MTKKSIFRKWLVQSCVWQTTVSLVFILIKWILDGSLDGNIDILSFLLILPCGMTLALADVFGEKKMSAAAKLWLRYLFTLVGFYCFLWLPAKNPSAASHLFFLGAVSVLYWLAVLIISGTNKRIRSIKEESI